LVTTDTNQSGSDGQLKEWPERGESELYQWGRTRSRCQVLLSLGSRTWGLSLTSFLDGWIATLWNFRKNVSGLWL